MRVLANMCVCVCVCVCVVRVSVCAVESVCGRLIIMVRPICLTATRMCQILITHMNNTRTDTQLLNVTFDDSEHSQLEKN